MSPPEPPGPNTYERLITAHNRVHLTGDVVREIGWSGKYVRFALSYKVRTWYRGIPSHRSYVAMVRVVCPTGDFARRWRWWVPMTGNLEVLGRLITDEDAEWRMTIETLPELVRVICPPKGEAGIEWLATLPPERYFQFVPPRGTSDSGGTQDCYERSMGEDFPQRPSSWGEIGKDTPGS